MANQLLRELLVEARWPGRKLAAAVNSLGAEAGLSLSYNRTSVAHWLSGTRPRPPIPELVAEAFTRELGRKITVAATGLAVATRSAATVETWVSTDTVTRLARLGEGGAGCVYQLDALSVPGWVDLAVGRPATRADGGAVATIGTAEVDAAEAMVELCSDADLAFGGGRIRPALSGYLRSTIVPWLRANARPALRCRLAATAARLCYLCGFSCFDDELHGTAQHYYLAALRLAGEAGAVTEYARALRALSVQARMLGHHRRAVDLAESAVQAISSKASPRLHAFLLGQLAVAEAAAGDRHQALVHLHAAETQLERSGNTATPEGSVGIYHPAALAHHHAAVRACLGDRNAAITALGQSLRHRPPRERRARAITLARLAELHLAAGHLDRACHTWEQFLQDYPPLQSRRADSALTTLRAGLRPHAAYPAAREVRRRASTLHTPCLIQN